MTHSDVLTATEACDYLRLSAIADSPEAARTLLYRLVRGGRIHPLRWSKEYLFARPDLDAFVSAEIAGLNGASSPVNEGNDGSDAENGESGADGYSDGHPEGGE